MSQPATVNKIVAIDNEFATLVYYPEKGMVHHTFHKPVAREVFQNVLLTGTELMRTHGGTKWLSDDRGYGALSPEDTEWGIKVWFPQAKAAGWKSWALVVPEDIMARMNLMDIIDHYFEMGVRIMVFTSPEEAMPWLENLKVSEPVSK